MPDKNHYRAFHPSRYLGHWDLMDEEGSFFNKKFTITKVCKEPVVQDNGTEKELSVIHLKDSKPMIVNTWNTAKIKKIHGADISEWVGKEIELTTKEVMGVDGSKTRALRVIVPKMTISGDDLAYMLEKVKSKLTDSQYIAAKRIIQNEETESFQKLRRFLNKKV